MPRHFVRINDDLLLIEIIRRLRHEPVPNIDYVAYKGVKFSVFLTAARTLFTDTQIRAELQRLVDQGVVCVTGLAFHYFSPHTFGEKGLLNWWHPDHQLNTHNWFTAHGTPSRTLDLTKVKKGQVSASRVLYRFIYVVEDGLPMTVQDDMRRHRIAFTRETLPLKSE